MPTLTSAFTYSAPVTVLAVISSTGPTTGGTSVLIIGTEFRYGAAVTFGGTPATLVIVTGSNFITCTIPAHAAGAVDVVVTNTSGLFTTGTLVSGFTYAAAAPTVTAIRPIQGSTGGGEAALITGTGFVATPGVKFGATAATSVVRIDANRLSCTTPAHTAGIVDVVVTNPDTQVGTLYNGFEYTTVSPFVDTGGWWLDDEGFAGGTDLALTPAVPNHPRLWAKIAAFATGTAGSFGGFPAASVMYRNHLIYAGDDYTLGTTAPVIRIFDGLSDRLMVKIPNTSTGTIVKAIMSMLLVNGIIYVSTLDSGTSSADYAGRVFMLNPIDQTLTPLGTAFTAGEVPYALAWHMDRLFVGTNQGDAASGKIYFIRPEIDTAFTTDYDLNTSTVGGAVSMASYGGKLYIGTDNAAAAFAKILVRDSAGAYTTSDTGTGGTAAANNAYLTMIPFGVNLYASFWNPDTPNISKIRKFDGSSWSTVYTGSSLTLRPFMLSFLAETYLYMVGGGSSKRAALIRTLDGTTWEDLTAYLAGPITETALPLYGVVGI